MRIFLMPIEVASRELKYKVQLANAIKKEGDIFIVCKAWTAQRLARSLRFINWIGQNCFEKSRIDGKSTAESIRQRNGQLFYIDEEGGVYPEYIAESILKSRYTMKSFDNDDVIFSWGIRQKKILEEINLSSFAVGHPRFTSIKSIEAREPESSILIMTNFSLLLSEKSFKKNYFDKTVFDIRLIETSNNISKLFNFLAQQNTHIKIYIRIHPSEDLSVYRLMFRHFENVRVLDREDLDCSLRRAVKVYHFNCTTALDSFARCIPTVNLADGDFTIIKDIPPKGELINSEWLVYPAKFNKICKIIDERSKVTTAGSVKLILIQFATILFSLLNNIRSPYFFSKYEKNKLGSVEIDSLSWRTMNFIFIYGG